MVPLGGERLQRLDGKVRKLYADLGDGATEIVHVGKNRFVAPGTELRLAFDGRDIRHVPEFVRVTGPDGKLALAQR